MGQDDGSARDRVITIATRRALIEERRRARGLGILGAIVIALGVGALEARTLPFGALWQLVCDGVGVTLVLCGLGVIARAGYRMATTWRRIRELDERTGLPVARVRSD